MRLSRTDLVPVLVIVAGGALGASFSFGLLGSRSDDVPATEWTSEITVFPVPTETDGVVGQGSSINIRGFSSLQTLNQPLIYVDGIRVDNSFTLGPDNGFDGFRDAGGSGGSALDDINPEDIESIEIIKGPAAATLYGTEASAGVIQIVTKKER